MLFMSFQWLYPIFYVHSMHCDFHLLKFKGILTFLLVYKSHYRPTQKKKNLLQKYYFLAKYLPYLYF